MSFIGKKISKVQCGRLVSAVIYTATTAGEPQRVRAQKQKATTMARAKLNAKFSYQKLERTLAANFDKGDLFITLTYDSEHYPPNRNIALQRVRRFLYKLRCKRKQKKKTLKYIYVTEEMTDRKSRLHHHLVINGTGDDSDDIKDCWNFGSNNFKVLQFDEMNSYEALAMYLTKEPRDGFTQKVGERTWTPSLGLIKPLTDTQEVPDYVTVAAPPGAQIIYSEGPVKNGYGEFTWIKYLLPYSQSSNASRPRARRRQKKK